MKRHPVAMVALSADDLSRSSDFYATVFGWQLSPLTDEIAVATVPAGPSVVLRAGNAPGFQRVVPFLSVDDVPTALDLVVAAGGSIERAPWPMPSGVTLARFRDPGGTIYGLTTMPLPQEATRVAMPLGGKPAPAPGSVCGIEMHAADFRATARFFGDRFGWTTEETMPQYMALDPGIGIDGVFQSHTPSMPAVAYVYVEDVADALARIDGAGGRRSADAMEVPGMGTFGYFVDPSGTNMGLIGR